MLFFLIYMYDVTQYFFDAKNTNELEMKLRDFPK